MDRQLECLKTRVDRLTEALDRVSLGMLIVTHRGEIVERNRAATRILEEGDGWLPGLTQPCPASPLERDRLHSFLAEAARSAAPNAAELSMHVTRPSGKTAYSVLAGRLSRAAEPSAPFVLVVIVDPERDHPPAAGMLRHLYGLTPAEARLAEELAGGFNTSESATRLGVSRHTVRTQTRAIFSKTGVRRQSQLVRLVHHAATASGVTCLTVGGNYSANMPHLRYDSDLQEGYSSHE
jgi:DNA-binding CsgD family transcriptional regulator